MMGILLVVLGIILGAVLLSAVVIALAVYFDINLETDSQKNERLRNETTTTIHYLAPITQAGPRSHHH
jgi:hypothetical protein